ncbi:MAG: threonine-phosphate decarboxylase, partial [Proteobacteria bacterium]|nr:threonine-phosphate decarboxylase [Pseudomonadota bacterium]
MTTKTPYSHDHGGGIDAATAQYGGARADWLDLSTGINPCPYPIGDLPADVWRALPDQGAETALISAARAFWSVPTYLDILPTNGASAAIARLPTIFEDLDKSVQITMPTYNEWAASFDGAGWTMTQGTAALEIYVHPNNPDGRLAPEPVRKKVRIYDES